MSSTYVEQATKFVEKEKEKEKNEMEEKIQQNENSAKCSERKKSLTEICRNLCDLYEKSRREARMEHPKKEAYRPLSKEDKKFFEQHGHTYFSLH